MKERNSRIYWLQKGEEFTLPKCVQMDNCIVQNIPIENFRIEICPETKVARVKMIGLEIKLAKA